VAVTRTAVVFPEISGYWPPRGASPSSLALTLDRSEPEATAVLAWTGRLDNARHLASRLGLAASEPTSTRGLLEAGWRRWGADLHLEVIGDYAFAAVDPARHRLHLVRDHHGAGQMFFRQRGDRLFFASSLATLLDGLEDRPDPNLLQVAQMLSTARFHAPEETLYRNVFQLPPGHRLEFDGRNWTLFRYWNPRETPIFTQQKDEAVYEAFLDCFTEAVACRIAGARDPAIALSGGLDSGAVAAVADGLLREQGRKLQAYTAVPMAESPVEEHQSGSEQTQVEALRSRLPALRTHWLDCSGASLLGSMQTVLGITRQPLFAAANCYWIVEIMRMLEERGADALLTGHLGNATISWTGNRSLYLRSLRRDSGVAAWVREIQKFRDAYELSPGETLRKLVLPSLVGESTLERLKRRQFSNQRFDTATPLKPRLTRELAIADRVRREALLPVSPHHSKYRDSVLLNGVFAPCGPSATLAAAYGVELSDPTADKRLIEFCYALPETHYVSPGIKKGLLRGAFANRLPGEVLWSKKTGLQASDIIPRLRRERREIEALLDALAKSPLADETLNLPLMKTVFEEALETDQPRTAARVRQILLRGVMTGMFLQGFET
jgi:asparagine synthase (glutamine-hydrolysing)